MSRYDGLIIPRSYSEYINKTDAATLQQALQQNGVLSDIVKAGDEKAVKSKAIIDYLQGDAQKTINGGLKVDSLTVNGSEVAKKSMLPINSDKVVWGSNIRELTVDKLKEFYNSLTEFSYVEFVCRITELSLWGLCKILRLNSEWGSIHFDPVGESYLIELKNGQWLPIKHTS